MRKIKQVHLHNFQSHKDTTFNFDDGVNILCGNSNNGKTAVIRAINYVAKNKSGMGFVSSWAKELNTKGDVVFKKGCECSVTLVIVDDQGVEHTITRLKSKTDNVYLVDGVKLEAVGSSVPQEVESLLSMHECNIQAQLDQHFLLTMTPGQIAHKLNELVHLDTIDQAYEYMRKGKTKASTLHKTWESTAAEHRLAMDGLKNTPELIEKANDLTELITQMEETSDDFRSLIEARDALKAAEQKLQQHIVPNLDSYINEINETLATISELRKKHGDLVSSKNRLQGLLDSIHKYNIKDTDVEELSITLEKLSTLEQNRIDAGQYLSEYKSLEEDLQSYKERLVVIEKDLPDICPVCNRPLDKECL